MNAPVPAIAWRGLEVSFGTAHCAVRDLDLELAEREFLCIVGPTGCGKSTLLNTAAGLLPPTRGEVQVFGARLAGLNRDAGYLFQADALLPWRTALSNVAAGLEFRGHSKQDAAAQARHWLSQVDLAHAADRYPHQLSGGMKKRVALAQVLAVEPRLLLMDEPFSALDIHTRSLMENELLALWERHAKSVVFITHDLEEAIALGDRVVVLSAGPASRPIADFRIDLPRPRDVAETRLHPRFIELHAALWASLRDEVRKSHQEDA